MGYAAIPLIAAVSLAVHHVFISEASRASKSSMLIVVLTSLIIWQHFPRWLVVATLLQSAAGAYMLVHMKLEASRSS